MRAVGQLGPIDGLDRFDLRRGEVEVASVATRTDQTARPRRRAAPAGCRSAPAVAPAHRPGARRVARRAPPTAGRSRRSRRPAPTSAASSAALDRRLEPEVRRPLIVELGLLLEGRQLPIVEGAATVGQRLDLVLQRLRLAWRDHGAELGVQAVAVTIDQSRVVFGRIDLGRELVELGGRSRHGGVPSRRAPCARRSRRPVQGGGCDGG